MHNHVPDHAILKEDKATYTPENAIYSRKVTDGTWPYNKKSNSLL